MSTTIKDIARATGLSLSTISKYINGGSVRPANRVLIEQAIKEYDFHPNEAARAVRRKTYRTIAVIIPSLNIDYCRTIAMICQQVLMEKGYASVFYDCDNSAELEDKFVRKALCSYADGIIAVPMDPGGEGYQRARAEGIPLVFIGPATEHPADYVVSDDAEASAEIIRRLNECGHSNIGIIVARTEYLVLSSLLVALSAMLEQQIGPLRDDHIFTGVSLSLDGGYDGAKRLLALEPRPTALICINSELMLGAKLAILESGLRIPDDVSLCGFALPSMADSPVFSDLTLVRQPVEDLAALAANVMLRRIGERASAVADDDKNGVTLVSVKAYSRFGASIKDLREKI